MKMPVQLTSYLFEKKLCKAFAVYVKLKQHNDKIHACELPHILTIDKRTWQKHLKTLLALNWIGFNPKSNIYHVRGIDVIRNIHSFDSRRAYVMGSQDHHKLQIFLAAVLICNAAKDQQYFKKIRPGAVVKKSGAANQSPVFDYIALGNYKIAKILKCKQTRACVLKNKARKAGYLFTKKKLKEIKNADANYRKVLSQARPIEAMRLRLIQGKVFRQLPDEIIPNLQFKKLAKLSIQKSDTDTSGRERESPIINN
jgi:hypothetical protein